MKDCAKCGVSLPLTAFSPKTWRRRGKVYTGRMSYCRACRRKQQRRAYALRNGAVPRVVEQFTETERERWERNLETLKAGLVKRKVKRWRERVACP